VLNHVILHQSVIGLETKQQLKLAGETPDTLIGCVGGGSNFGGFALPFLPEKLRRPDLRIIAVEPSACPSLTKGVFAYDFGDTGKLTPLVKMFTLGHTFVPEGIHAGGLRYHGTAPIVAHLADLRLIESQAITQNTVFAAALQFARTEGFIPAPETSHAIACTIDEAVKAREEGKEKVILFNWSGHGLMDLTGYDNYFQGKLTDHALPEEELQKSLAAIKHQPKAPVRKSGKW